MVDKKKLEAFANPGGPPKASKGAPPPPPEAEEPEGEESEEGGGEEGRDADALAEKFGGLIEMLEQHGEEVEEQCELLDQGTLTDPGAEADPEFQSALNECLGSLDAGLVDAMKTELKGVSWDDAMDLAEHLADEGKVADPEAVAGFLFHTGHLSGGE